MTTYFFNAPTPAPYGKLSAEELTSNGLPAPGISSFSGQPQLIKKGRIYQPPHRPPFSVNHGIFSPAGKKQTHFQQPLSEARKF